MGAIILSIAWVLSVGIFISLTIAPSFLLINSTKNIWVLIFSIPFTLFLGVSLVFMFLSVFFRLLPKIPKGKYKTNGTFYGTIWSIENGLITPILSLLQNKLFIEQNIRYLILKAFNMDLCHNSWLTTKTYFGNPRNIHLGANSLVGEFAHLAPSYQPKLNVLVVDDIYVGDDSIVGGHSIVAAGTHIGKKCVVQADVFISAKCKIGDGSRIGARSVLEEQVVIGPKARIGKDCIIKSGVMIGPGVKIKNGSIIDQDVLQSSTISQSCSTELKREVNGAQFILNRPSLNP